MCITRAISSVLEKHRDVLFAYLFGSLARRQSSPASDIDVAVYIADDANPIEAKLSLIGDLADYLEREDIDVVILNTAPLSLLGRIMAHREIVLDRTPHIRHAFESLAVRKYLDFSIKEKKLLERRFGLGG